MIFSNKFGFILEKVFSYILLNNFRHRFHVKFKKDLIGWNIPGNPFWRLITVDLLVLTGLNKLIFIHKNIIYYLFQNKLDS